MGRESEDVGKVGRVEGVGKWVERTGYAPSSFLSTLSTAPEHPPHDMVTLKTYLCSPPAGAAVLTEATSAIVVIVLVGGLVCVDRDTRGEECRDVAMSRCRDSDGGVAGMGASGWMVGLHVATELGPTEVWTGKTSLKCSNVL